MSSTKTIPAIASNEYEFQWGREVLFLSNGSQRPTHAEVEPTVRKNRLSLVLRAKNMRRALHLVLLLTMFHYRSWPDECIDGWNYLSELRLFGNVIANPALATMLLPTFPLAVLMTYSTGMVSNDSRCVKRIIKGYLQKTGHIVREG